MLVLDKFSESVALLSYRLQTLPVLQRLMAKYRSLTARDQLALQLLLAFLIGFVIYSLLLKPAYNYAEQARRVYLYNLETLQLIEQNKGVFLGAANKEQQRNEGQSLLSVASSTARQWQLSFNRFEPVNDTSVRVWLDGATFPTLTQWLDELHKSHSIAVRQLQLDRSEAGSLAVSLVLQE